jgi:O-antigen/teichoic acid export membrane protein/glycosyltransferase involved in cell wall biosynthesis
MGKRECLFMSLKTITSNYSPYFSKIKKAIIIIEALLAFLIGINFYNFDSYLMGLLAVLLFLRFFLTRDLRLTFGALLVFFFSIFIFSFYTYHYGLGFYPFLAYLILLNLLYQIGGAFGRKKLQKELMYLLVAYALGTLLFLGLQFGKYLSDYGLNPYLYSSRRLLDFWSKGAILLSPTMVVSYMFPLCALMLASLLKVKKNLVPLIIGLLGVILSIAMSLVLRTRTLFFVLPLAIALYLLYYFYGHGKTRVFRFLASSFLVLIILGLFLILTIHYNLFSMRDYLSTHPLFSRFIALNESNSERISFYRIFFNNFLYYPFGGMSGVTFIDNGHSVLFLYAHNVWLDFYVLGGFFPALAFLAITIYSIRNAVLVIKTHNKSLDHIMAFLFVSGFYFLLEPVFEGNLIYFLWVMMGLGFLERMKIIAQSQRDKTISITGDYKVLFATNFISAHNSFFHQEMISQFKERYQAITFAKLSLGHENYEQEKNYPQATLIAAKEDFAAAKRTISAAQVIIYGNMPYRLVLYLIRHHKGKQIYRLAERRYKKGDYEVYSPLRVAVDFLINKWLDWAKVRVLSLSAYTAFDNDLNDFALNRTYQWTYFAPLASEDVVRRHWDEREKPHTFKLVWVSRLVDFKHPKVAIELAHALKVKKYNFSLTIIGGGNEQEQKSLHQLIEQYHLDAQVELTGFLNHDETIERIRKSDILLSTSDREEGFGVSIAEAMANGVMVVSSYLSGGAPFLIQHNKTGLLFDYCRPSDLVDKITYLLDRPNLILDMSKNSYTSYKENYDVSLGVKKLRGLIEYEDNPSLSSGGLLTKCQIISEVEVRNQMIDEDKNITLAKEKNTFKNKPHSLRFHGLVSYLSVLLIALISFFYTPWLINTLGQSSYAIYSLSFSLVAIFTFDFGIGTTVSTLIAKFRATRSEKETNEVTGFALKITLILALAFIVLLLGLYFSLEYLFTNLSYDELIALKTVYVIFAIYSLITLQFIPFNGLIIGNEEYASLKTIALIFKAISVVGIIIALSLKVDLYLFAIIFALGNVAEAITKYLYAKRRKLLGVHPRFKIEAKLKRKFLSLMALAAIEGLAARLILNLEPTILAYFGGTVPVAIFALASAIEGYVYYFSDALNGLFLPHLAKMNKNKASNEDKTNLMIKVGRYELIAMGLIILGIVVFGNDFILHIWKIGSPNGEDYSQAALVLILLILPGLITYTQEIGNSLLLIENKTKYFAYSSIIASSISIGLSIVLGALFPDYVLLLGALAIFIGKIVGYGIVRNYYFNKHLGLDVKKFFKQTHLAILPGQIIFLAVAAFIFYLLPQADTMWFLAKVFFALIAYVLITYNIMMNKEEKAIFTPIINKINQYSDYEKMIAEDKITL